MQAVEGAVRNRLPPPPPPPKMNGIPPPPGPPSARPTKAAVAAAHLSAGAHLVDAVAQGHPYSHAKFLRVAHAPGDRYRLFAALALAASPLAFAALIVTRGRRLAPAPQHRIQVQPLSAARRCPAALYAAGPAPPRPISSPHGRLRCA